MLNKQEQRELLEELINEVGDIKFLSTQYLLRLMDIDIIEERNYAKKILEKFDEKEK